MDPEQLEMVLFVEGVAGLRMRIHRGSKHTMPLLAHVLTRPMHSKRPTAFRQHEPTIHRPRVWGCTHARPLHGMRVYTCLPPPRHARVHMLAPSTAWGCTHTCPLHGMRVYTCLPPPRHAGHTRFVYLTHTNHMCHDSSQGTIHMLRAALLASVDSATCKGYSVHTFNTVQLVWHNKRKAPPLLASVTSTMLARSPRLWTSSLRRICFIYLIA